MSQSVQSPKAISIASVTPLWLCVRHCAESAARGKVMALKQHQEINKQKLAQYTWQETEGISIKGNVKDTKVYRIQMQLPDVTNNVASTLINGVSKQLTVNQQNSNYQKILAT